MTREDQLITAIIEATAHVSRQVDAGKHEQDRKDARKWLDDWRGLVKWAQQQPRQRAIRFDAPFDIAAQYGDSGGK